MNDNSVYRASPLKRRRRTKAQSEQLDLQIFEALKQDHPQSTRHVFYLMTDPRLPEPVEKTINGYKQVQDRLVKLRRNGTVPYAWVSDTSRSGYFVQTYSDIGDFLRRVQSLYRADLWKNANVRCEVWVESRSIAGIVLDDCQECAVSLYPAGGFSSIAFAYEAAEQINESYDGRPVISFYIGDLDPAGVLIDGAIEREIRKHLRPEVEFIFRRIGITAEQIEQFNLPTKARKKSEKRATHISRTVEAEAMPAHTMRRLLRTAIEAQLPPRALEVAKVAEASERDLIGRLAQAVTP